MRHAALLLASIALAACADRPESTPRIVYFEISPD